MKKFKALKKLMTNIEKIEREILKIEDPEKGQGTLEYAAIAVGILLLAFGAIQLLGGAVAGVFERAASALGG